MSGLITLLDNETATGGAEECTGGQWLFRIESTDFNGATAKLQIVGPNGGWIDVVDVEFTANGATRVFLPGGLNVRVEITVAVPNAGVYSDLTLFSV